MNVIYLYVKHAICIVVRAFYSQAIDAPSNNFYLLLVFFREDPEEEKHRGKKHRTQHNWKLLRYTHIDSLRLVLAYFSFFLASIRMEFSIIYAEASFLSTDSVVQQFTTLRCFSFSSDMHIVVVVGASCWLCVVRLCVRFYYYYISHLFPAFYPVIVEWVPVVWLCPLCRR